MYVDVRASRLTIGHCFWNHSRMTSYDNQRRVQLHSMSLSQDKTSSNWWWLLQLKTCVSPSTWQLSRRTCWRWRLDKNPDRFGSSLCYMVPWRQELHGPEHEGTQRSRSNWERFQRKHGPISWRPWSQVFSAGGVDDFPGTSWKELGILLQSWLCLFKNCRVWSRKSYLGGLNSARGLYKKQWCQVRLKDNDVRFCWGRIWG